jgi:phosphate acetyltransferase
MVTRPAQGVVHRIATRAKALSRRIVLPESEDPRILEAALLITERQYAEVTLLGERPHLMTLATEHQLRLPWDRIESVEPARDEMKDEYSERFYQRRRERGLTREQAAALSETPVYFGAQLVADGRADGMVSGSICPTADTIRAALWSVGAAPGCRTVSSCSLMQTRCFEFGVDGALIFADTGVVPEPTVEQLAEIAVQAGDACRVLLEAEARVAMISFSTKASALSPAAQLMAEATKLARSRRPDMFIDGELQVDAALVPEVAARKVGQSDVAGQANVLVFPNLSTGNVAYKLVERLGQALALGPLLMGLNKPINDLSRGCSVEDIVLISAITAVQSSLA